MRGGLVVAGVLVMATGCIPMAAGVGAIGLGVAGAAMGDRPGGTAEVSAGLGIYSYDRPSQPDFDGAITYFEGMGIYGKGISPIARTRMHVGAGADETSARAYDAGVSFETGLALRGERAVVPWYVAVMGGIGSDSIADTALELPVSAAVSFRLGRLRPTLSTGVSWRYFRKADPSELPADTSGIDRRKMSLELEWISERRPFLMISGGEVDGLSVGMVAIGVRTDFAKF
ncbi:MAG: hypothetical protein R2939_13980 [Kofleriaceae bacterium]